MVAASRKIVLSGILAGLTSIILFAESFLPAGRLGLFTLSSFFTAVIIIECGIRTGWIFYVAVTLLGFILLPDKLGVVPYAVFFGIYGIVKYYTEKIRKRIPEFSLKYIYFNVCLLLAYILLKELIWGEIQIELPVWVIIIGMQIVFLIYDYIFSAMIDYYVTKIKKKLRQQP